MCENAYLSIKNPKASRALKRALDPGRRMLATSATFGLRSWGPPLDQILDPHLDISITVSTTNNMGHRFPPAGVCVKRDHELWRLVPYLDTTTPMSIYQPASSLQIKFCPFYQPLQSLLSQTLCK